MRMLVLGGDKVHANTRLADAGRSLGHRVDLVPMTKLSFALDSGGVRALIAGKDVAECYDAVLLRHFAPRFVNEGLAFAEWAKTEGVRVFDEGLAEKNFIAGKLAMAIRLAKAGVPVARGFHAVSLAEAKRHLRGRTFPMVAKRIHGSRGRWVFKVDSRKALLDGLTDDLVGNFTFQDFLPIAHEYRVIIIGGKAIGAMEKFAPAGEFRHNVALGADPRPARLSPALLRLCERAAKACRNEFAGVDLAIAGGRPFVIEVNRCPEYQGFEQATGIDVAKAFIRYAASETKKSASR